MPIYEYQCQKCHETFEYMQRMSEEAKTECEECKGPLSRLISNTSFALKGGGWYKDLYSSTKKDSKGSSDASTTGSTGSEASSASASSDAASSKPASDSTKGSEATSKTSSSTPTSSSTKSSD